MTNEESRKYIEENPLDPERWRKVGKARGWPIRIWEGQRVGDRKLPSYIYHALRYFETLLTAPEKIKEYWENLP